MDLRAPAANRSLVFASRRPPSFEGCVAGRCVRRLRLVEVDAELFEAETHAPFDRPARQAEPCRDLGVCEPSVEGERDDLSLSLTNRPQQRA